MDATDRHTRPPRSALAVTLLCTLLGAACPGAELGEDEHWPRTQSTASTPDAALETGPLPDLPARRVPLDTGIVTPAGEPVGVRCGTCHASQDPASAAATAFAWDPTQGTFHRGPVMAHGGLACGACHQAPLYDDLHLADGALVPLAEAATLCAQCHGPQYRDYRNSSHGGLVGHWDATRGPQARNTCTACHDPHAPAYVGMIAAPRAFDRFLPAPAEPHEHTGHAPDTDHADHEVPE
jgi:hypothetical protein